MAVVPTSKPRCMLASRLLQYHRYPARLPSPAPELSSPQRRVLLITLLFPYALSYSSLLPSPGLFGFLLCLHCHPLILSFFLCRVCVCVPVSLMTRSATFSLPDTSGCSLSLTYSKNLPLSRATGGHVVSLYSALPFGHVAVCAAAHVAVCAALGGWRCWALPWS